MRHFHALHVHLHQGVRLSTNPKSFLLRLLLHIQEYGMFDKQHGHHDRLEYHQYVDYLYDTVHMLTYLYFLMIMHILYRAFDVYK